MNATVNFVFGFISDIDPTNGKVKVVIPEETDEASVDGGTDTPLVTDWIPISTRKSQNDKETFPYDVNEHVWCIMDEHLEYGVCCGAIYSEEDLPDGAGADIYRLLYKDGSYEMFDRSSGDKTFFTKGNFKASTNAGAELQLDSKVVIKNSGDSANAIMKDLIDAIKLMTFTNGAGVTGVANNVASFTAIETRVDNFYGT